MAVLFLKKKGGKHQVVLTARVYGKLHKRTLDAITKKNGTNKTTWKEKEPPSEIWLPSTSPEAKSAVLSRVTMKAGSVKRKNAKSKIWRTGSQAKTNKARRSSSTVCFSTKLSLCKGDISSVLSMGLQLLKDELEAGNRERAQFIAEQLKGLEAEYNRRKMAVHFTRLLKKAQA